MISTFSFPAWVTIGRLVGDHLWQSTLFAVVAGLLTLAFRHNRAEVRNRLWLAASVKFLIPFAALVAIGSHFTWRRAIPLAQNPAPFFIDVDTMSQPFSRLAAGTPPAVVSHSMASVVPIFLFMIWLCGCAAVLLTWWTCWRRVAAAVREASPVEQGPALDALRRLEVIAGITRPVVLVSSSTSLEPGVFGIARPVLLWPRSLAEHLTNTHAEMILAHELSHVRRRDNLAAAVHMVVETVFWFHPLVWWLGARMVDERERACDEEVLRLGKEPRVYAESILRVCEFYVESPLACVSGVTGSDLKKRIQRIMKNHFGAALSVQKKLLLLAVGTTALAAPLITGVLTAPRLSAQVAVSQSPTALDRPKFDVVSIKRDEGADPRGTFQFQPGRFVMYNIFLRPLIQMAYKLPMTGNQSQSLIVGAPDWVDHIPYDVEAKADGDPPREQMLLMMQAMLADRFKLAAHWETRQLPVYALTMVKQGRTGPQLVPHAADNSTCRDPAAHPLPPHPGQAPTRSLPPCGRNALGGSDFVTGGGHVATETTTETLAKDLSYFQQIDRAVIDRTGLSGTFDINIDYVPFFRNPQPDAEPSTVDSALPSTIFTALQEQLGLKLVPQTGPVDVLVIDHVEEPSPN